MGKQLRGALHRRRESTSISLRSILYNVDVNVFYFFYFLIVLVMVLVIMTLDIITFLDRQGPTPAAPTGSRPAQTR